MSQDNGTILVVDDNEMNRDMLARRLTRRGYQVSHADSGAAALDLIAESRFDLVLLDVMMPEIDGLEVLRRLRRQHDVTELPVIMVTAKDQSGDVVDALKHGANDYVTKPIDFPVLNARVATQMRLRRLTQQKDDFLRIASHDLKNPLMGVHGSARLLEQMLTPGTVVGDQEYDLLCRISRNGRLMQRIIADFLDFQALEDGQIRLDRRPCDLNAIARDAVDYNADYARSKDTTIALELADSLPGLDADPDRLGQVVHNFVSNAIKFSPKGSSVVLRTRAGNDQIRLEVADNGPGLKDEDRNNLFRKYARLSNKPTGGEKSSGLGLSICKQMIDLHGGRIGADANPGGGSVFWFSLPPA